jgi:hypothetical protein
MYPNNHLRGKRARNNPNNTNPAPQQRTYSLANPSIPLLARAGLPLSIPPIGILTPPRPRPRHINHEQSPGSPEITWGSPTQEERLEAQRKARERQRQQEIKLIRYQYVDEIKEYKDKYERLKELYDFIHKKTKRYPDIRKMNFYTNRFDKLDKPRIQHLISQLNYTIIHCKGILTNTTNNIQSLQKCLETLNLFKDRLDTNLILLQNIYDQIEPYVNQMNRYSVQTPNIDAKKRYISERKFEKSRSIPLGLGNLFSPEEAENHNLLSNKLKRAPLKGNNNPPKEYGEEPLRIGQMYPNTPPPVLPPANYGLPFGEENEENSEQGHNEGVREGIIINEPTQASTPRIGGKKRTKKTFKKV